MSFETQTIEQSQEQEKSRLDKLWEKHGDKIKALGVIGLGATVALVGGADRREVADALPVIGGSPGGELTGDNLAVAAGGALMAVGAEKLAALSAQQGQAAQGSPENSEFARAA